MHPFPIRVAHSYLCDTATNAFGGVVSQSTAVNTLYTKPKNGGGVGVDVRKTLAFLPTHASVDEEAFEARADMHRLVGGAVACRVISACVSTDTARTPRLDPFLERIFRNAFFSPLPQCNGGATLGGHANKRRIKSQPPSAIPDEGRL